MNITLRQCEIVLAAAETATFSAAAKSLGISQPSLSESIRRIERETGLTLFERTTRSIKLTDDGRRLAAVSREVLRDVRHALDQMTAGSGRLTIAALPSIACAALPQALAEFSRSHPGIDIALHDVQHERAMAMVADRLADLAITIKPAAADGLAFESIVSDAAHLVCRRDHPLAQEETSALARHGRISVYRDHCHLVGATPDRCGFRARRNCGQATLRSRASAERGRACRSRTRGDRVARADLRDVQGPRSVGQATQRSGAAAKCRISYSSRAASCRPSPSRSSR